MSSCGVGEVADSSLPCQIITSREQGSPDHIPADITRTCQDLGPTIAKAQPPSPYFSADASGRCPLVHIPELVVRGQTVPTLPIFSWTQSQVRISFGDRNTKIGFEDGGNVGS
ncbi:hypothetical protein DFP73DRAFT_597557 [Morchella snyderi]|nr:hypothetical protein DFP73DRAFT_597557 [Morchella snyderi]